MRSVTLGQPGNPFVVHTQGPLLLRQILLKDSSIQRPLLRVISGIPGRFRRDEMVSSFPSIVSTANESIKATGDRETVRSFRDFKELVDQTTRKRGSQIRVRVYSSIA